jgi:hypothetical protein
MQSIGWQGQTCFLNQPVLYKPWFDSSKQNGGQLKLSCPLLEIVETVENEGAFIDFILLHSKY